MHENFNFQLSNILNKNSYSLNLNNHTNNILKFSFFLNGIFKNNLAFQSEISALFDKQKFYFYNINFLNSSLNTKQIITTNNKFNLSSNFDYNTISNCIHSKESSAQHIKPFNIIESDISNTECLEILNKNNNDDTNNSNDETNNFNDETNSETNNIDFIKYNDSSNDNIVFSTKNQDSLKSNDENKISNNITNLHSTDTITNLPSINLHSTDSFISKSNKNSSLLNVSNYENENKFNEQIRTSDFNYIENTDLDDNLFDSNISFENEIFIKNAQFNDPKFIEKNLSKFLYYSIKKSNLKNQIINFIIIDIFQIINCKIIIESEDVFNDLETVVHNFNNNNKFFKLDTEDNTDIIYKNIILKNNELIKRNKQKNQEKNINYKKTNNYNKNNKKNNSITKKNNDEYLNYLFGFLLINNLSK